jgi:type VI secretion system secreted protein VgrG
MACPGVFSVKGSGHSFDAGASSAAQIQGLPDSRVKLFDQAFIVKDEKTGIPMPNRPYRIRRSDGSYEYGTTDASGKTHLVSTSEVEKLLIEVVKSQHAKTTENYVGTSGFCIHNPYR